MKAYVVNFIAIISVFSFNAHAQKTNHVAVIAAAENAAASKSDIAPKDDRVIVAYYVEETINMAFGKRITKYEVSKLNMVSTYDLGPNNTRVVTPIYRKAKVKTVDVALQSKTFVDSAATKIKPIKVEVIAPTEAPKYLNIDVVDTYAKVLDKGYKSIEMLTKVADRAYFDGDLTTAAKYYEELFGMNTNLEAMYYYRFAQSLKGTDQTKKAEAIMKQFENKNGAYKVAMTKE